VASGAEEDPLQSVTQRAGMTRALAGSGGLPRVGVDFAVASVVATAAEAAARFRRCRGAVRVAWPFPLALLDLGRFPARALEVRLTPARRPVGEDLELGRRVLGLSYGDSFRFARSVPRPRSHPAEAGRQFGSEMDSSLGVVQRSPLRRISTVRPLQAGHSRRRYLPSARVARSARGPPLPFLPASTVCSARYPAGLLHPASGHGVRHVSSSRAERSPARPSRAFPSGASPYGAFPSDCSRAVVVAPREREAVTAA
jgi:hypothetical protein